MLSEARQEATDWIPGHTPLLSWGLASQLPLHLAPVGPSVAAAVGLRRKRTVPHLSSSLPGPC